MTRGTYDYARLTRWPFTFGISVKALPRRSPPDTTTETERFEES